MKKKKEKIKEKLIKNKKAIGILHISHTLCSKLYIYIYIYIIVFRFPTIQSAQLVELTYKR